MDTQDPQQDRLDLLQAALDHINQGFSVFGPDLRLVAWNKGLYDMLDFPMRLAYRGAHLEEFLRVNAERGEYGPGDIEGKIARRVERAKLFEPHYFERIRPSGQVIAVHGTPLPQGGFVTTYSDVTEERRRQEKLERTVEERTRALRQSEDWLRLVTNNIPALIAYMGPGPVYQFANRRYAEWFGQSVSSIVGKRAGEVIGDPLYQDLEPHIARAFEGQLVTYDYSRTRPTGETVHMRSTLIPDITLDGRTLGIFVLSLDATDQKRSEASLLQSQRMDAVGKLAGGLAHDFNNLLTILMGNLLTLKRKGDALTAADVQTHLDPMMQAAQRGADLTQRLLAFNRGKSVEGRDVCLDEVLTNVTTLLHGSLPKSIELIVGQTTEGLIAHLDPAQIETAVVNLVFNARDALPDGGRISLDLGVETVPEAAASADLPAGTYARLTVADNGTGMDEDTRMKVFEPFFTTKPFGTGSGLGLSMVYGFARQTGGHVDITSTPGDGTTVSLLVPARSPEAGSGMRAALGKETANTPLGQGELVLLVEDNPDVAATVADQLQDLGYTVLTAENAEDGLMLAGDVDEIRVVLSDIVMPGHMNGLKLAREISARRSDVGIALMTGYAAWDTGETAESDVPHPVLSKPFDRKTLADTVYSVLPKGKSI